ncbi:MAG: Asp-tRNA(Asn)/Glu-tRNA(Gln) amidotransferase subunit GatB [Planctomycetota bacterium]
MPPRVVDVKPIVGMEVHVELRTRRKMFAPAPNPAHPDFADAAPNTLTDPVVLALPGALPVLNRAAIELSIRVGLALGCEIASRTKWDRKSYFYPDLPKAYQISQYDEPICGRGAFDLLDDEGEPIRTIGVTRAHLEEDAGKLLHEAPGGHPIPHSIVDLNRAGAPLLEIVTEPDFRSADECVRFAMHLRSICRWLGATEGDMQKGHMRFEPNINCVLTLDDGREVRTPIVEVKNLNSFRALGGAVEYELKRQPERFREDGREMGRGMKVTRGWDDARLATVRQREKEDAHDYRYFPDPDLPTVTIDTLWVDRLRAEQPELPHHLAIRYAKELSLASKEANALIAERPAHDYYTATVDVAVAGGADPTEARKAAANLVLQAGFRLANERDVTVERLGATSEQAGGVVSLRLAGTISANAAEQLFEALCESDETADAAAERLGLVQVSDAGQLDEWCRAVMDDPANAAAVADLRGGKPQAAGRLIGGVMKLSGGQADAKAVRERILALVGA